MLRKVAKGLMKSLIAAGVPMNVSALERIQEWSQLRSLLFQLHINCVLDVGANHGQYAHELRGIGYRGLIVSFEPASCAFDTLSKAFRQDKLWRGYKLALGDADGEMPLNVIPDSTDFNSFLKPLNPPSNMTSEQVPVRRIDGLLPDLIGSISKPRVFLKMDTQGYDLDVFRGAKGCMKQICGLQSEISVQPMYQDMPHYLDALALYESEGYKLFHFSGVSGSRLPTGEFKELNCFMKRG